MMGLGLRTCGLGLGTVLGLGSLVIFSAPGNAAAPRYGSAEPKLRITVRIQDYAQVAPKILDGAKREATAILGRPGIEVGWVHCTGTGLPSEPLCLQPFGAIDLGIRILPQTMGDQMPRKDDVFGFAVISTDSRPSFLASVFYDRVQALSDALGYSRGATLGYVMAHEIGHLLLRTSGHSPLGIMRALLTPEDLLRPLRFTPTQSLVIRADVARRNRMQQVDAPPEIPAWRQQMAAGQNRPSVTA